MTLYFASKENRMKAFMGFHHPYKRLVLQEMFYYRGSGLQVLVNVYVGF